MADPRTMLEQALTTECGSTPASARFTTPEHRAALRRIVLDGGEPMPRRGRAIYLLGLWRDDETVVTIDEVVDDVDEAGRIAAASALGRVATPSAVAALERLTRDPSTDVRRVAINSLGDADTPVATAILRRVAVGDASELNRARAEGLLGEA